MNERTCVSCKHWDFDPGEPHYLELTPGCSWSSSCLKGKWSVSGTRVSQSEYRAKLLTAQDCALFTPVEP